MSTQHPYPSPGHAEEPAEAAAPGHIAPDQINTAEITRAALAAVPGTAHAAILRILDRHHLALHAPTDYTAAALDGFYAGLGQGPSRSVVHTQRPLVIEEMSTETRWPRFTARAAQHGITSMLCLPLLAADHGLGTLNLYATHAGVFTADDGLATIFATHAARALHADAQRERLTRALETRDAIEQAIGILMARHHLTAGQALDRLTVASRAANFTLVEVAGWLIDDTDHIRRTTRAGSNTSPQPAARRSVVPTLAWLRPSPPHEGACVVELGGEIDMQGADQLRSQLLDLSATTAATDVVVELSHIRFFGAAGVTLLLQLRHELQATGHTLHLAAPPRAVTRPLALLTLRDMLPCWPTIAQAAAALHHHPFGDAAALPGQPAPETRRPSESGTCASARRHAGRAGQSLSSASTTTGPLGP